MSEIKGLGKRSNNVYDDQLVGAVFPQSQNQKTSLWLDAEMLRTNH